MEIILNNDTKRLEIVEAEEEHNPRKKAIIVTEVVIPVILPHLSHTAIREEE
jgi:hypothetical protein